MEREAMAAAFKFEEAIQAGYDIDKVKSFCDYADYVLDLKERNGLAPTTIERYRAMLPRINDAIGHLKSWRAARIASCAGMCLVNGMQFPRFRL